MPVEPRAAAQKTILGGLLNIAPAGTEAPQGYTRDKPNNSLEKCFWGFTLGCPQHKLTRLTP